MTRKRKGAAGARRRNAVGAEAKVAENEAAAEKGTGRKAGAATESVHEVVTEAGTGATGSGAEVVTENAVLVESVALVESEASR